MKVSDPWPLRPPGVALRPHQVNALAKEANRFARAFSIAFFGSIVWLSKLAGFAIFLSKRICKQVLSGTH